MFRFLSLKCFQLGLLTTVLAASSQRISADIISDVVDYQLAGARFPVQFLYDDSLPNPEFRQIRSPLTVVRNPGITAPREVYLMEPGADFDPNLKDFRGISDIVALRPIAGNMLELRFWSDDPTISASQFEKTFGLPGVPNAGVIAEDGLAHDVNAMLFGNVRSPFQHIIVASDVLNQGILPGVPGKGGPGSIAISETLAFRGAFGTILNEGMHGAAFYDAPGFGESDLSVFTAFFKGAGVQNTAIRFTEGDFGDNDQLKEQITDIVAMRVDGNCGTRCRLVFGEWSEDPSQTSNAFLTAFFRGAVFVKKGPFKETALKGTHPPLLDLFNLNGKPLTANGQQVVLTAIDFKSDPPIPEPATWSLFAFGFGATVVLVGRRKSRGYAVAAISVLGICAKLSDAALLTVTPVTPVVAVQEGATTGVSFVQFTAVNVSPFALEVFGATEGQIRDRGPDFGDKVASTNVFGDGCIFISPKLMAPGATCSFNLGFFTPGVDVGEVSDDGISDIGAIVNYCDPSLPPTTACLGRGAIASATGFATVDVLDSCESFLSHGTCPVPTSEPPPLVLDTIVVGAYAFFRKNLGVRRSVIDRRVTTL